MKRSEAAPSTILRIKVIPRSSRNQLAGVEDGLVKIKLTAPPVDGKANKALCSFLAELFGKPQNAVTILNGEKGRLKTIRIAGMNSEKADRMIRESIEATS
ncbi:DUF167 domain-containing protein [Desulfatiglans anilini]|uniref:DUF167 domain-containing protein n=1 Tax=Desulfatiglans anilini TaxID=90728 RepID=UPI000424B6CA|nr:DUF167 domain-containing protein [Desulfatiglans anilini]